MTKLVYWTLFMASAILAATALMAAIELAHAQQETFRDNRGRTLGIVTTDSTGREQTFRDDRGNTVGTVSTDSMGNKTYRDERGNTLSTATPKEPRR